MYYVVIYRGILIVSTNVSTTTYEYIIAMRVALSEHIEACKTN